MFPEYIKNNKEKVFLFLVLVSFFIFGLYLRLESLEVVRINHWITRDFDRAFNLFDGNYIPLAGPEINNGGRLPGPFLYFILTIPLFFKYSYESIFISNFLLNVLSLVMMFLIVRKFFGYLTAVISTILFTINPMHVDIVAFPINPAFIFPFILLFLWFFLEFALEKNYKYFSLIFFVIALTIQIHFSVLAYSLVPIVTSIIHRIKIPPKHIFISISLVIVCLLPYFIYKKQFYETKTELTKPFGHEKHPSVSDIIKIISVGNVINKIANNHTKSHYVFPKHFNSIDYYLIAISFYGLIIYIFINSLRKGASFYKKEIVLILTFYVPALTYEIMKPATGWHFWHYFIFIPPYTIVIALFFTTLFQHAITKTKVCALSMLSFLLLGYLCFFTYDQFRRVNYNLQHWIRIGGGTYNFNNYKHLINEILIALNLSAEEYVEKVYFEGFSPESRKLIELFENEIQRIPPNSKGKDCYYIYGEIPNKKAIIQAVKSRLKAFLHDNSLKINDNSIAKIFRDEPINNSFVQKFSVYGYNPKFDQPCYTNSLNQFIVDKDQRNFLKQSYGVDQSENALAIKEILKKETYDTDLRLVSLENSFVVFYHDLKTPIELTLFLKFNGNNYILKNEISYYSWGKKIKFRIKELILSIDHYQELPSTDPVTEKYEIITENSWISENSLRDSGTENFKWYREFILPKDISFVKNKFQFNFSWKVKLSNQKIMNLTPSLSIPGIEMIK